MAQETDKKTLALIAEIKKQKEQIAKVDRPTWKTNCAFVWTEGSSSSANIQVVTVIKDIICMAGFLIEKKRSFEEAAKILSVENPPIFTWNGFTFEDWIADLKLRITKIQINTKRKKLETLEDRLNSIISPELRNEIELEKITEELSLGK